LKESVDLGLVPFLEYTEDGVPSAHPVDVVSDCRTRVDAVLLGFPCGRGGCGILADLRDSC
jgi:hypothetical protein